MRFFGPLLRWIVTAAVTFIFIPITGEFAIDWVRERGLYEHPSEQVEGAMIAIQGLIHDPRYQLCAAFALGLFVGVWLHWLATKLDRGSSGTNIPAKPAQTRMILRLRFTGEMESPHLLTEENVLSWFAYWSPGARATDQAGNALFEVPSSWAIFIDFKEPVSYHQLLVGFTGGRPHSYEVRQALTTSAVITFTGVMPACEMEAVTRGSAHSG